MFFEVPAGVASLQQARARQPTLLSEVQVKVLFRKVAAELEDSRTKLIPRWAEISSWFSISKYW
jgi:hypothetical protein